MGHSQSKRVLTQFSDIAIVAIDSLNVYIEVYPGAPNFVTTGVPVVGGFYLMTLLVLRNYVDVLE